MIKRGFPGTIDHMDAYAIGIRGNQHSIDYLTAVVFTSFPGWARLLFNLRNLLVKPFGLATGRLPDPGDIDKSIVFRTGERAVLFTVVDRSDTEILMAEDDRHLYFRFSVLADDQTDGRSIWLTTLVQFHNRLGWWYFNLIKPFHGMIVRSMLSRLSRRLA